MTTLEQYLGAIRSLLPHRNRDDIVAELRAAIGERHEEREAELGRPLTAAEQEQMLQEFGHPVSIASRYRTTSHLIGPNYYPLYLILLQRTLLVVAVGSFALGWVIRVAFGAPPGAALLGALGTSISVILAFVGAATLAIAILERYIPKPTFLRRWRAEQLPRDPLNESYSRLGDGLACLVNIGAALWWYHSAPPHTLLPISWVGGVQVAWGAFYSSLGTPLLVILLLQALMHALSAARLLPARLVAYLRPTMLVAALALALLILRTDGALMTAQFADATVGTQLTPVLNLGFRLALVLSAIGSTVRAIIGYWRIARPHPR